MSKNDINFKRELNELAGNDNREPAELIDVLMDNNITIKGNVLNRKQKELVAKIVERILQMDWKQGDNRIQMMFDLSLLIDELKKD